ncbi:regena domain (CCR-Not complex subunit 3) [Cryptosporidium xiaoi]|uniref:Regena domain (CCR-Not complex subunit 3) n=1 Tax=Cryptosporidium xiaoi TaxID=659607 RepID=A0AAV9Y277_9CRYT
MHAGYSDFISRLKLEFNNVFPSLTTLSSYKIETRPIEDDIEEIKKKAEEVMQKYESKVDFLEIPESDRQKLEECYKSIINIKKVISRYEEKINTHDVDNNLEEYNKSLLKEMSKLEISGHSLDEGVSENESCVNSEETFNNFFEDNENLDGYSEDDYFTEKELPTEYKNSMGFYVELFPRICTDALDFSFENKLTMNDSIGKHIQYTPRMVWHNPRGDFPSVTLFDFHNPWLFDKLDLDTLFFIFYFQQGTFQQFLAIQELKKKKWRFHKKCFAWFFKRSDSKVINDDVDVADYVYFDFEKDWCQKIKNDFAFEFIHLDNTQVIEKKFSELVKFDNGVNSETIISDDDDVELVTEK